MFLQKKIVSSDPYYHITGSGKTTSEIFRSNEFRRMLFRETTRDGVQVIPGVITKQGRVVRFGSFQHLSPELKLLRENGALNKFELTVTNFRQIGFLDPASFQGSEYRDFRAAIDDFNLSLKR
jgi:hypothetical protein